MANRTRRGSLRLIVLAVLVAAPIAVIVSALAAASTPPITKPTDEARAPLVELGASLYAANCSSCHGIAGQGSTSRRPIRGANGMEGLGPSLRGVGALAADFYTRTGYMPLGDPHEEPTRSRVLFDPHERRALVRYIASLGAGPSIPRPRPAEGDVGAGRELFTEHCSGCHQVVAEGGILTGAKAPPLNRASPVEIAEAVRIGPYVMPKFSESDISDAQLNSIVAYVQYAQNPDDRGGWGINHLGPFPEGMVTWLLAMVVIVVTCMIIGKRLKS